MLLNLVHLPIKAFNRNPFMFRLLLLAFNEGGSCLTAICVQPPQIHSCPPQCINSAQISHRKTPIYYKWSFETFCCNYEIVGRSSVKKLVPLAMEVFTIEVSAAIFLGVYVYISPRLSQPVTQPCFACRRDT